MTDDDFGKALRETLMEVVMEELGPVWYGVPLGDGQPSMEAMPEKSEHILQLAQQRQEEKENEPPGDS